MGFQPKEYAPDAPPAIIEASKERQWIAVYWHPCSFSSKIFAEVMMNHIRNPNVNSNHLFRADILLERNIKPEEGFDAQAYEQKPQLLEIEKFHLDTIMVRRLIPRNVLVDKPLDQTCLIYNGTSSNKPETKSLVIYLPHISYVSEAPFYHPAVRGIAFLHSYNGHTKEGVVSIHYSLFESGPERSVLDRTALHLLSTLHKHGEGCANGYQKRVHHDTIIPQATVQNTYARIKAKYAKRLIDQWVEVTDPGKHVFEDLSIAAFLIELWAEMYPDRFPGFVDIGCGNGLLVHILVEEGYSGWGFDARRRKSWDAYPAKTKENLKELVLIPGVISITTTPNLAENGHQAEKEGSQSEVIPGVHNGIFPQGTFIISNHADELTPWTPLLATLSSSAFIMIPCCSHNLTGSRFRAPPPKDAKGEAASKSAYNSLVGWVAKLAQDCGWVVEKEMLRIPSTRNTALIGRRRLVGFEVCGTTDVREIVDRYGGATGWEENAMKLVKASPRGH
jgi:tRNASer (uridine44-2'-O)-methyltransferase